MLIKLQEEMTVSKTLTPTPIQAHFAHLLASSDSVFFFTAQRIQPRSMDIYKEITERIINEMEKGIIPWEKPWIASGNCVAHTTGNEQMKLEDDFMWITSHAFSEMRLLVEGSLNLFEDESGVLCRLAREADKIEAMRAFNDIGTALYEFRRHIKTLQEAHHKAELYQRNELAEE